MNDGFLGWETKGWGEQQRKNGCVTGETRILLADGSEKEIKDIIPYTNKLDGDSILSLDGTIVYPVMMVSGPEENFPVITLTVDVDGASLEVTSSKWHPFMNDSSSFLQAYYFGSGDRIMTSQGQGRVTETKVSNYSGSVWNMFLASYEFKEQLKNFSETQLNAFVKNSLLGLSSRQQTYFANGIPSGSLAIQLQLVEMMKKGVSITKFV